MHASLWVFTYVAPFSCTHMCPKCEKARHDDKFILAKALNMQLNTRMCPNKKNEQSSSHLCHLISERHSFAACATPFLHILIMAAAVWQLINENDGACVIAVLNAVLHCHATLLLLFHELVVVTSLAITVVLQLMYWAQQSMWLNACCGGLVCEDCGCAP